MRFICGWIYGFSLILFAAAGTYAQSALEVDVGVRGGAFFQAPPIEAESNHYFPPFYTIDRTLFSVGPGVAALFYDKVDVRFEAVRSEFKFNGRFGAGPTAGTSTTTGSLWQFPLLATYRFGSGTVRPFAGGGLGLGNRVRGTARAIEITQFPNSPPQTSSGTSPYTTFSHPSIYYISGGIEAHMPLLSIRPEFRYSRWGQFSDQENQTLNSRNQVEIVVGIFFHAFRSGNGKTRS
jgi:hypothetical protein